MIETRGLNESRPSAAEEEVCLMYISGRFKESGMGFVYIRNIKHPRGVTFSVKVWFIFAASSISAFRRTKKPLLCVNVCFTLISPRPQLQRLYYFIVLTRNVGEITEHKLRSLSMDHTVHATGASNKMLHATNVSKEFFLIRSL